MGPNNSEYWVLHERLRTRLQRVDGRETARCRWVLVVAELFSIAVNDYGAKDIPVLVKSR